MSDPRLTQQALGEQLKLLNKGYENLAHTMYDYIMYFEGEDKQKEKKAKIRATVANMKFNIDAVKQLLEGIRVE